VLFRSDRMVLPAWEALENRRGRSYPGAVGGFVGRPEELARLRGTIAAAQARDVAVAVVVGDPGTGKTRLVAEALAGTELRPRFRVVGYEAEREVPLAAASELLRTLASSQHGEQLEAVLFRGSGPLEPIRVFEATHRALVAQAPALIVLDDAQWIDTLSVALCDYLIRAARDDGQGLAVLAASRPPAPDFAEAELIRLAPLARDEGVELVCRFAPEFGAEAAEEVWRRAAGNPFWIEALARADDPGADAADFVTTRLLGAGADAAEVTALLAVAARPLMSADVAELEGWPAARVEKALADLAARGLVVAGAPTVQLVHDLVREAARATLPRHVAVRMHARLAGWFERRASDDLLELLEAIEHGRAAGSPVSSSLLKLVESPQRRLLGIEGLHRVVAIADAVEVPPAEAAALSRGLAKLAVEIGDHVLALRLWARTADLVRGAERAAALLSASQSAARERSYADALKLVVRAREESFDDPLLALEINVQEAAALTAIDPKDKRGRALVAEGERVARELGLANADDERARRTQIALLRAQSRLAMYDGRTQEMNDVDERVVAVARGLGRSEEHTSELQSPQ